ncbi:MAG TPA: SGNH/GDSL hydrolase family protein [Gammaproteobacteria bacterium]|nr:SGNH/GDSL hydrolase family protein [Gammaproteobacteria bacterium]
MKLESAVIKSLVFAFCLMLTACGESSTDSTGGGIGVTAQCADDIDNDNDGLIDLGDPGCVDAADNDESDVPVSSAHDAERANSYDNAWESAWVANVKNILSTSVGIPKTTGKVLQVGDSMTFSFAYGDWARKQNAATATPSDLVIMSWMHAGFNDATDGWKWSSVAHATGDPAIDNFTALNNANWSSAFVDNIFVDTDLNDAQFAVVMFNVNDMIVVENRINEFINAGIVPVLSTIPPRESVTDYNKNKADPYNAALLALAEKLSLPIIDFSKEIYLRRPGGTWAKTLIGDDGVHPSGPRNGYTPISDPYADGGDAATHTTGAATLNSGYLLRTWLTVQKMKEIKQKGL